MDSNYPLTLLNAYKSQGLYVVFCGLALLTTLLACMSSTPPTTSPTPILATETNLIGVWQGNYSSHGVEIIILKDDGTYYQSYENANGYLYTGEGDWNIENLASGKQRIHLKNGLWFPLGPEIAELRGMDSIVPDQPHTFWDPNTLEAINMTVDLVLEIVPSANSKGFVLIQYSYDIESTRDHLIPANR